MPNLHGVRVTRATHMWVAISGSVFADAFREVREQAQLSGVPQVLVFSEVLLVVGPHDRVDDAFKRYTRRLSERGGR